ncbi:MAG TPA: GrpB family protein [Casimicrobiaceae bacterium]|nr:GrpB family protein [Casimicrobiaceae bacterium]
MLKPRALILPYPISGTGYVEYEPGVIDAANSVIGLIQGEAPWTHVEHIGSTAVPGCAGKGVVDLMALYPAGKLEAARAVLDGLGFQHQKTGHVFPEARPMRVGAIQHNGKRYRLHVHVIAMDDPEVASLRRFRDALRVDPALRNAYEAKKLAILKSGFNDPSDYTYAKGEFIRSVIGNG